MNAWRSAWMVGLGLWLLLAVASSAAARGPVMLLDVDGHRSVAAEYLTDALEDAAREGSQLVVLRMDTPGVCSTPPTT